MAEHGNDRTEAGLLRRLLGASALFFGAILASRLLGLVRQMLVAHHFGAGPHLDAYYVAHTMPFRLGTAVDAIATGAMIPVVARYLRDGRRDDAWRVIGTILVFVVALGVPIVVFGMVFSDSLASLLGPQFAAPVHRLTARLLRILAPYFLFAAVGGILSCAILAHQRFLVPAIAHVMPNIVIIAVLVALVSRLRIHALALGVTLGGLAYLLVLLVRTVPMSSGRPLIAWFPRHPGVRKTAVLSLPLLITAVGLPIITSFERGLLSGASAGSIAALRYTEDLIGVPTGLLITSLGTVLLPILAWDASAADSGRLTRRTSIAVRLVVMATVLAVALLLGLRRLSVVVLYGSGAFDARAVTATSNIVPWLAPMIVGVGLNQVFIKAYHAMQDTLTPALIWLTIAVGRGVLGYSVAGTMAARGIALSRSIASFGRAAWLGAGVCRRLHQPFWRQALRLAVTCAVAGAGLAWGLQTLEANMPILYSQGRIVAAGWLLLLVIGGSVAYTAIVLALNPRERTAVLMRVRNRYLNRGQ